MFGAEVRRAVAVLQRVVGELDPRAMTGAEGRELVELFVTGERVCAAGKVLAARAADEAYVWRRQGYGSAAEWLAFVSGKTLGSAIGDLDAARTLDELPQTAEAYRRGELSAEQTKEIASAAKADPSAESELLDTAKRKTLPELKRKAERVRAQARPEDVEERHARIHRARYLRHWTDSEGAAMGQWRVTPDVGAKLRALIEAEAANVFQAARTAGVVEDAEAYAADALANLLLGDGKSRPKANVHVRVDADAYRRGHAEAGETCEVDGIPVPVRVVRDMAADGTVDVHLVDGADVVGIQRLGAYIPKGLRDAVWAHDDGHCRADGCAARRNLEIDHIHPRERGGLTTLANLQLLCVLHHRLKSAREANERAKRKHEKAASEKGHEACGAGHENDVPDHSATGPPALS